jgi:hypothetical protein
MKLQNLIHILMGFLHWAFAKRQEVPPPDGAIPVATRRGPTHC